MRNYEHDNAEAVKNRSGEEEEKGCGKIRRTYGTLHATGCYPKHRKYVAGELNNCLTNPLIAFVTDCKI